MAELINKQDSLNQGREKINASILASERAEKKSDDAVSIANRKGNEAIDTAQIAEQKADNIQTQLDTIVINGDSSVEAAQARVDENGHAYSTLKDRLDTENVETLNKIGVLTDLQTSNKSNLVGAVNENTEQLALEKQQRNTSVERSLSTLRQGKKGKRAIVSFILDDGRTADYTRIKPIAEAKQVPFGIGVITSRVGTSGYMTWEQIHELHKSGFFEIMSHTHEHRDSREIDDATLEIDVSTSLRILREQGFNPDGFVYPFNSHDERTANVVGKYFTYSFSKFGFGGEGVNYGNFNNYAIARVSLGSYFDNAYENYPPTNTLEYYKARVDEALEKNNWLVFVMHPWFDNEEQFTHLEQIIDYIRSLDIDIVPPSEGFDIYGNVVQIGYYANYKIDADGVEDSVSNGVIIDKESNIRSNSDSYTSYRQDKITYTRITDSSLGFPSTQSGILITQRISFHYYGAKQQYIVPKVLGGSEIIYQRWVDSNGNWTEWENITSSKLSRYEYRESVDVPANGTREITVSIAGVNPADTIYVHPRSGIVNGIMYNAYITNLGDVRIRLFNITSSQITVDRTWYINITRDMNIQSV